MVYIVKESFDVAVQYIIHFPEHDQIIHCLDRIVCFPSGSESVRTVKESRFIYIVQYICHDPLYQLVFIARYSKRSCLAVCLGYFHPPHRLRPV